MGTRGKGLGIVRRRGRFWEGAEAREGRRRPGEESALWRGLASFPFCQGGPKPFMTGCHGMLGSNRSLPSRVLLCYMIFYFFISLLFNLFVCVWGGGGV